MATGKLTDDVKMAVVQALACFDPPATIRAQIKADFDVEVSIALIECYDPEKRAGRSLSKRWRVIHAETRKAFLEDTSSIAISHRAVRLRALQRMANKAESMGNLSLAAQLHEQAAKESGNSYTNRRELTGKDGAPLPTPPPAAVTIFSLPDNGR